MPEVSSSHARLADAPVQLVVFDLGRVFIRICDHWGQACDRAGVTIPDLLTTEPGQAAMLALSVEHESGRLTNNAFFQQTADLTGLSPTQVEAIASAWLIEPFPGVEELVTMLKQRGTPTACLSNTNALHWRLMHEDPTRQLPLDQLDHQFASHLMGVMKPDADIYAQVEAQVGLPAASILFFDDHAPNIDAAHARGWQAVKIDPSLPQSIPQILPVLRHKGLIG